ncbi:dUTP diphosphatase [Symbiobacterium thermophilum]|uniref:dUTP diphosphatase n=1 Tax=Symbiobacterium thermophilum TaxID=2734 RepID=A0A1Y2T272_SYMTR|nr:dUTP diphosphatase [Symbiobacterium thermophilum]MBY6276931.1 deoxyuridine 5'-triphosphate nucleotidohydrolase [Symbiobacterium thermophilum]OTA40572.1 MAG: deoxyuridine 5'-triphosphate nucleotidohydrolase [Symbiobacterium thermophilum]
MTERRFAPLRGYEGRVRLPQRKTRLSAGYDLEAAEEVTIPPGQVALVPTGLKAYMGEDEVLLLAVRSSLAVKRRLALANGIGVIDADYADNPDNEGHILVALVNLGTEPATIARGERVAQGIFVRYLTVAGDQPGGLRTGGIGSTGTA